MNKIVVLLAAALIATPAFADDAAPASPAQDNSAAPAATPAPAPAAAEKPAPKPTGTVARATFATGIQDREPVDSVTTVTNDHNKVYFFTELKDMAGQTITHRWEHNGKVMAEVPFKVGGNRWRVFSSKQMEPDWTGTWKVSVVDSSGATLAVNTLEYTKAPAKPAEPAAQPATPAPAPAPEAPSAPAAPKQ